VALTDTEIRKAKAKASAYRMTDGGGLYIYRSPLLVASSGAGSIALNAARSGRPLGAIPIFPCLWPENVTQRRASCWPPAQTRWPSARPKKQQQRTPSKVSPASGSLIGKMATYVPFIPATPFASTLQAAQQGASVIFAESDGVMNMSIIALKQ
jgi:hypothetical protein